MELDDSGTLVIPTEVIPEDGEGQGGSPATEPEVTPPVVPVVDPVVVEPEPEVELPKLPGQATSDQETEWLRQTVARLAQELKTAQTQKQEWELANLSDEDRAAREIQARQAQLQQQYDDLQGQQARQQWKAYYEKWVPAELIKGDDPIDWQHTALTHLYTANAKLQRENAALKKVVAKPAVIPPKVSAPGSAGASHRKHISEMTLAELEAIKEKAIWGNMAAEDYPLVN